MAVVMVRHTETPTPAGADQYMTAAMAYYGTAVRATVFRYVGLIKLLTAVTLGTRRARRLAGAFAFRDCLSPFR